MMNRNSLSEGMTHGFRAATAVLARSGLIIGIIAALLFAFPPNLHAQSSPLTLQPSTGNVGIGTTTPAYPLSVYRGGSGTTSNIESGFNGAVAQSRFAGLTAGAVSRVWGSGLNITNGNGGYEIYDYTAGASRFYINTGGNVGIGTITPVYALSVYRGGSGTTSNIESGVNGAVAQSRFAGFTGGAVSRVWGSGLNITNGNGGYEIYDYTAGASRFYINTGGNVGIGTTSPLSTLDVRGGAINVDGGGQLAKEGNFLSLRGAGPTHGAIFIGNSGENVILRSSTADNTTGIYLQNGNESTIAIFRSDNSVIVNGTFTATVKNFQIDHPLEPDKKHLVHSALEGPEVAVYYRGEAQLENGQVSITLPSYFESLTRKENRTVQLTPIDGWAPLYIVGGVKDGKITVRTGNGGDLSQRFYWEVKAVRADVDPLVVEKVKDAENQRLAGSQKINP